MKFVNLMVNEDFRVENYEHIVELTYIANIDDWLKVQPDLQYVFNPTNCNCNIYSFVYGTRVELAF